MLFSHGFVWLQHMHVDCFRKELLTQRKARRKNTFFQRTSFFAHAFSSFICFGLLNTFYMQRYLPLLLLFSHASMLLCKIRCDTKQHVTQNVIHIVTNISLMLYVFFIKMPWFFLTQVMKMLSCRLSYIYDFFFLKRL